MVEHLQTVITGVARRAGCSGYMGLYSLLVELQADVYYPFRCIADIKPLGEYS